MREERRKFAYTFVGAAIVVHVLFLLSTYFAIAVGLAAGIALLFALWKETSGRRFGMSLAFVLAFICVRSRMLAGPRPPVGVFANMFVFVSARLQAARSQTVGGHRTLV